MDVLVPMFEKSSGDKVTVQYESSSMERKKLEAGEPFDVAVATAALIDALVVKGLAEPGSKVDVGAIVASLAFKHGAPTPDVSTPEALKAVVLNAKSISFSDPAAGGTSSVFFNGVVARLGIADEVAKKSVMTRPGQGAFPVGDGRAEIGVAQSSEVALVPGLDGVRILPGDPKSRTAYAVGVSSQSSQKAAAMAFEKFLLTPEAAAVRKAKGMAPD